MVIPNMKPIVVVQNHLSDAEIEERCIEQEKFEIARKKLYTCYRNKDKEAVLRGYIKDSILKIMQSYVYKPQGELLYCKMQIERKLYQMLTPLYLTNFFEVGFSIHTDKSVTFNIVRNYSLYPKDKEERAEELGDDNE